MITAKLILLYLLKSPLVAVAVDTTNIDHNEVYCMAQNIWHEARNESIKGQYAIAQVTMNRVKNDKFPNTVCKVVKQRTTKNSKGNIPYRYQCAYSWYCDGLSDEIVLKKKDGTINQVAFEKFQIATMIAVVTIYGNIDDYTNGSTHYHNPKTSNPKWKYVFKKTESIGNHDFYKDN